MWRCIHIGLFAEFIFESPFVDDEGTDAVIEFVEACFLVGGSEGDEGLLGVDEVAFFDEDLVDDSAFEVLNGLYFPEGNDFSGGLHDDIEGSEPGP